MGSYRIFDIDYGKEETTGDVAQGLQGSRAEPLHQRVPNDLGRPLHNSGRQALRPVDRNLHGMIQLTLEYWQGRAMGPYRLPLRPYLRAGSGRHPGGALQTQRSSIRAEVLSW